MASKEQIDSGRVVLKDLFQKWFRIPEYQRQYVWGEDQINNLLDDLEFALENKPNSEYFLGTIVYQKRAADPDHGRPFEENDLLDGQQRLTTLLLLFAVLRDMAMNDDTLSEKERSSMIDSCQQRIYQQEDIYDGKPERTRLTFDIRGSVRDFIDEFVKVPGGTQKTEEIVAFCREHDDKSTKNMASAINTIIKFWQRENAPKKVNFLKFINQNALLIYVAPEDMEDAFRMFTILNDRGVQLRNSDILKSINLGAVESESEKMQYAAMWEDAENSLGDSFDRFLTFIRTILVKEKARLGLLKEFEDKIYEPKENDKITGKRKPQLLKKGKQTFEMIKKYLSHYEFIFEETHDSRWSGAHEFDNLLKIMNYGLPASDWVPPLLFFYEKFRCEHLLEFLKKLNRKFAGDWLCQYTPTERIESMNQILRTIEKSASAAEVLGSSDFEIDQEAFCRTIEGNIYGRRFALYTVLLLDFKSANHVQQMNFEKLSIEHILPQNPDEKTSQWCKDFSPEERAQWTGKLGNLVVIPGNKNTALGNLDFQEKKLRYFRKKISTCLRLGEIYANYQTWTLADLKRNHEQSLEAIKDLFEIVS